MENAENQKCDLNPSWTKYLPGVVKRRLNGREDLQKVIGNTGWLFSDKIIRMGMGLVIGAWVARYLGPEQFGLMSFAGSFVALFSVLASLGLDGIVVRNIVLDPSSRDVTLGTAFLLKVAGGAVTLLLSLATVFLLRPEESTTHWLVGIIAIGTIFQAFDVVDYWFQSQVKSKRSVYAKNGAFLLITVVRAALVLLRAPLVAFAWANTAEIVAAGIGLIYVYRRSGLSVSSWRFVPAKAKVLLTDSWPLILSGLVGMIYMRIDQVMLGQMASNHEVGIYAAAVRLAEVWYFVPMSVAASVFPSVIEAKGLGEARFYKRLQKFYNLMAIMGYAVAIPVTFLAGWVIVLIFGPSYSKAGPMLAVLIWGGIFVNLGVAFGSFLTTMNWTKVFFMTASIGCVVNVGLNLILIPRYGGLGASIATLVGYFVSSYGVCFLYRPLFKTGKMLTTALTFPKIW